MPLLCFPPFVLLPEDDYSQENGPQSSQSISPPASPVAEEGPFETYFEEKVPVPHTTSKVLTQCYRLCSCKMSRELEPKNSCLGLSIGYIV